MAGVSYDLDTSGGLMPLIRALVKPPDEDLKVEKAKKSHHPYYRRPGKGHNHDSCDACEEGGDLICCDRCPASFHLGCHDPPLDEKDIPEGQWLCKECRNSDPPKTSSSRAPSPCSSDKNSRNGKDNEKEKKTRTLRNNRSNSSVSSGKKETAKKKTKEEEPPTPVPKEPERELTAMEMLAKAASIMNPRQFELPREMRVHCPFPGTDKEGRVDPKNNSTPGLVTVDGWGCVPLPARVCFACNETCKIAPLLQCDYCTLLFHQDCLDPPLTALPSGRWMCPNHVENYIDWKLVNSISATERVALWEKFSGPVDQHAVKIDFIRRARRIKPLFRMKVPVGVRGRVVVPAMVRHHYQRPPPLLPSRREYVRCRNVLKELQKMDEPKSSEDEQGKHIICMNLACPMYLTKSGVCRHEKELLEGVDEDDAASDLKAIMEATDPKRISVVSNLDEDKIEKGIKRRKTSHEENTVEQEYDFKKDFGIQASESEIEDVLVLAEKQLKRLDDRLVKLLAFQRLQQILQGESRMWPWAQASLDARTEEIVRRSIDRSRLVRYGFRHVSLPSELLSRADHERIAKAVWGEPPRPPMASDPPTSPGHSLSDAAVRATLCPVERPAKNGLGDGLGRPIPMRLSRLSIGRGGSCDVDLARHGKCHYTSHLHALIFYDEVSRHFELINYSEYGSRVNGALYSCDFSGGGVDAEEVEVEPRAAAVRAIIDRRRHVAARLSSKPEPASSELHEGCRCAPPGVRALTRGWEGSAVLQHGALLQFGCTMFVFSVTDVPLDTTPYDE